MIDRSIALPWVWLNGKLVKASAARVSVFDRSFTLGDGLFDTLRILDHCPLQWRAHWRRFAGTAKHLRIELPADEHACAKALQALLKRNRVTEAIARIHLSRGAGPRGYSIRRADSPTLVISLHAPPEGIPRRPAEWKLAVASLPFPSPPLLTRYKTASRLFHIAAKMEADRAGCHDALILNARGQVMEAISSNVFWMSGGTVFTPPLDLGILPGTTRARVFQICRRKKISCREAIRPLGTLLKADAVFLSVSTTGIIEVVQIEDTRIKRNPFVAELHDHLEKLNQREAQKFHRD